MPNPNFFCVFAESKSNESTREENNAFFDMSPIMVTKSDEP